MKTHQDRALFNRAINHTQAPTMAIVPSGSCNWSQDLVGPDEILRPIAGPAWHYRHRGRLSVIDRSIKKGTILVGFHEHNSSYVADMLTCEVIPKRISDLLVPMRELVGPPVLASALIDLRSA